VCNLGQFLISVAPSLSFALNGNRVAYLGQVFLPLLMLKMIFDLCNLNYKKWILPTLSVVSLSVLFVTLTPGLLPWYYKNVSIEVVDGVTKLIRDYGPMHILYYIYLLSYFALMLVVIINATLKKKITSTLHTTFLLCAVLCSIIIWFAERFLPRGFEFLTVSYVISELFILLLYGILQEYGIRGENGSIIIANTSKKAEEYLSGTIQSDDDSSALFSEKDIDHILSCEKIINKITEREKEVLIKLLANKQRKEIAEELFVTESTIKKHTSSIFTKFDVTNRFELYAKLKKYI
jgi:DNA-binding CsgD family transcriptional regulator